MAISPYFSAHKNKDERSLVNDLVVEVIQQRGFDFWYSPRSMINEDTLFGEDGSSVFQTGVKLEMMLEDVKQFGGDGEFMARVGLDVRDEMIFTFSKTRFYDTVKTVYPACIRPFEGDLIIVTLEDHESTAGVPNDPYAGFAVFEITFLENEKEFYQLGTNYTFSCTTHLFKYSHETMDTGVTDVDDDVNNPSYPDDALKVQTDGDTIIDFTEASPFGVNF